MEQTENRDQEDIEQVTEADLEAEPDSDVFEEGESTDENVPQRFGKKKKQPVSFTAVDRYKSADTSPYFQTQSEPLFAAVMEHWELNEREDGELSTSRRSLMSRSKSSRMGEL